MDQGWWPPRGRTGAGNGQAMSGKLFECQWRFVRQSDPQDTVFNNSELASDGCAGSHAEQ